MANKHLYLNGGTLWSNDQEGDAITLSDPLGSQFRYIPGLGGAFRSGHIVGTSPLIDVWNDPIKIGFASFAFGENPEASGRYSGALGANTESSGFGSFSGGHSSKSKGLHSFAFGQNAQAGVEAGSGAGAVAFGINARAFAEGAFAVGNDINIGKDEAGFSGAHSAAFGINVDLEDFHTIASGVNITARNNTDDIRSGHSLIIGHTISTDAHSVSINGDNVNIAKNSQQSYAAGCKVDIGEGSNNSLLHGENLRAGLPLFESFVTGGGSYNSNSPFSFIMGSQNQVLEQSAYNAIFPSEDVTIEGSFNNAHGTDLKISGSNFAKATGEGLIIKDSYFSSAQGHDSDLINANYSNSFGLANTINGSFGSSVFGQNITTANGSYLFAQGIDHDIRDSSYAVAFGGDNTIEFSTHSKVSGYSNTITGALHGSSEGLYNTLENSNYSEAKGWNNKVKNARYSSAFGSGNVIEDNIGSVAMGDNNKILNRYHKTDAFNGNVVFGGGNIIKDSGEVAAIANSVTGTGNELNGASSATASGMFNKLKGKFGTTSGYSNEAYGHGTVAVGVQNLVYGDESVGIGSNVNIGTDDEEYNTIGYGFGHSVSVMGFGGFAAGYNVHANGQNSFALGSSDGSGLENDLPNSLMVGFEDTPAIIVQDHTYVDPADSQTKRNVGLQVNGTIGLQEIDTIPNINLAVNDGTQGVLYHHDDKLMWATQQGSVTIVEGSTMTSPWAINGANINRLTGNVGIGTSSPEASLHVTGSLKFTAGTPGAGKVLTSNANGVATWEPVTVTPADGNFATSNLSLDDDRTHVLGSHNLSFTGTGKIGIGTNSPTAGLDVQGTLKLKAGTPGAGKVLTSSATGIATWETLTTTPADGNLATGNLALDGNREHDLGSHNLAFTGTGNVGIGTATPDEDLHVVGSVKIVDGNQQNGRVLTSDANGKASWADAPTGGGSNAKVEYLTFVNASPVPGDVQGFSKTIGSPKTVYTYDTMGACPAVLDPYVVHNKSQITSLRVNVTNIAIQNATKGTDIKLKLVVYILKPGSNTALKTFELPVDESQVGIWANAQSGGFFQEIEWDGTSTTAETIEKGEMIGLQFEPLSGDNGIYAISPAYVSMELTEVV